MNKDLYNPKYLIELCQKYRLNPSKKYGQNYLISSLVIDKIIEESDLKKTDVVVEVGSGFGVLTFALAPKVKKVITFEIEKKLESYWEENNPSVLRTPPLRKGRVSNELEKNTIVPSLRKRGLGVANNIEIIWGNVLNKIQDLDVKNYKVVANLPYQITSNVIRKFLENKNKPTEMVLMVQKEVGERICAKPGSMSLLALSVQYYATPKILLNVSRTKFFPPPKVDSVVIKLKINKKEKELGDKKFFQIANIGFASKRKMLVKNLSSVFDKKKIEEVFDKLNLNKKVRAQELSVEEWVKLAKELF